LQPNCGRAWIAVLELNRDGLDGGVNARAQFGQVHWSVRKCPKPSFAVEAANGRKRVDSGHWPACKPVIIRLDGALRTPRQMAREQKLLARQIGLAA